MLQVARGKGLKPLDPALGALILRVHGRAEAFPQMPPGFADFILLKCIIMARQGICCGVSREPGAGQSVLSTQSLCLQPAAVGQRLHGLLCHTSV